MTTRKITPMQAARMLGVDVKTVRDWCHRAVRGEESRVTRVEMTATGRYYLDVGEVRGIKGAKGA